MRIKNTSDHLTVQAIGGSHVVLLGWDFPRTDCDGLLGFAIHRTDPTEEEAGWLRGLKTFEETDPGSCQAQPIRPATIRSKASCGPTIRPSPGGSTATGSSR
jgi:hypothetical protein